MHDLAEGESGATVPKQASGAGHCGYAEVVGYWEIGGMDLCGGDLRWVRRRGW